MIGFLFSMHQWRKDGSFDAPSFLEPSLNRVTVAAYFDAPLRDSKRLTVERDEFVSAGVVKLLNVARPSAVFFFIATIYINAVNRCSGWSFSHVGKKVLKAINPSLTNGNPPSAVVGVSESLWVGASLNHVVPRTVCRRTVHPVFLENSRSGFLLETPTGLSFLLSERFASNRHSVSAIAPAEPVCPLPPSRGFIINSFNNKQSKPLTSDVFDVFCHFVTSKLLTVRVTWQAAVRQLFGSYPSQAHPFYLKDLQTWAK